MEDFPPPSYVGRGNPYPACRGREECGSDCAPLLQNNFGSLSRRLPSDCPKSDRGRAAPSRMSVRTVPCQEAQVAIDCARWVC